MTTNSGTYVRRSVPVAAAARQRVAAGHVFTQPWRSARRPLEARA
jgi:hypothetical protein